MPHIAVYARISRDDEDRRVGVKRQEADCRALAEAHWPGQLVQAYIDNNLSAADPSVRRPEYERLVADIRAGAVAEVVVFEQSRLTRQPEQWEALCVTMQRAGIEKVHTVRGGPVAVAEGNRLIGRILAAVDAEEVERTRARVRRAMTELAKEGRPAGGRPYGYRSALDAEGRKTYVIDEAEAAVVREVADRILRGEAMTAVARDLVERAVPTARGGRWTSQHIRTMLSRPSVAGLRSTKGEILGRAVWPPILDEATWRRVQAVLGAPVVTDINGQQRRITRGRPRQPRRYLLTGGLSRCGLCGAPLVAQTRSQRTKERPPAYVCHPNRGGCSRTAILAVPFEGYVTDEVVRTLSSPQMAERLRAGDEDPRAAVLDEIAGLEARWSDMARQHARGELPSAVWKEALAELQTENRRLHTALDAIPASVLDGFDAAAFAAEWPDLTLAQKREVIGVLIESVTLLPARPGTRSFDQERVVINWKVR